MRRLTKDERTGAAAIALVALFVCAGSFLWSVRNRDVKESEEAVKSIIIKADSVTADDTGDEPEASSASERKKKGKQDKSHKRKGKKKKETKDKPEKRKKTPPPSRDFLNDPV